MCVIVFFVKDRTNPNPFIDAKCYKRGDVIEVLPDGWQFSPAELSNPEWRILSLPNVTVAQASHLMSGEVDADPLKPSRMLQRRGVKFDLDDVALPAAVKTWLLDDRRTTPIASRAFTAAQFLAFVKQRPRRADPAVL